MNKFRGKSPTGSWVYGSLIKTEKNDCFIVPDYVKYEEDIHHEIQMVLPETVGQFTGLYDANPTKQFPKGRPIYEGHIVKWTIDLGPAGHHERTDEVKITPFGINIQHWNFTLPGYLPEIVGDKHK